MFLSLLVKSSLNLASYFSELFHETYKMSKSRNLSYS